MALEAKPDDTSSEARALPSAWKRLANGRSSWQPNVDEVGLAVTQM
jgi:hypothetical protein